MYRYNNIFCSNSKTLNYEDVSESSILKAFKFLETTNTETPFYKVIHRHNLEPAVSACAKIVKMIKENFDTCVYIGMGGAILNPKMMASLPHKNHGKEVHFIDTTDPIYFMEIMSQLDLAKTAFIATSNSGETSETISILGAFINEFKKIGLPYKNNFFFCTSLKDSTLHKIAKEFKTPVLEYTSGIGGRFSCFSNSAILPAMLMGVDLEAFNKGANKVADEFWSNKQKSKPAIAALDILAAKKPNLVTISYDYNLRAFLNWYAQIISESLGKDSKGYNPMHGIGPQEQHSTMQLYLDGPSDKLYTIIHTKASELTHDSIIDKELVQDGHFLNAKPLSAVHKAMFDATAQALVAKGRPVRTIELDAFNEESFGALIMHSSIEVIFLGLLLEINPFDQPGVEAIKIAAKRILSS
jgi:glucose-6-phosphate isomerase